MPKPESQSEDAQVAQLCQTAARWPDDIVAQMEAAFACDREGRETEAIVFYDAAWKLELALPVAERHDFMIGYGSTLKNVGRLQESEHILRQLVAAVPTSGAARVFLALTLHASGRSNAALGELLDLALAHQHCDETLRRYHRAISTYRSQSSPD